MKLRWLACVILLFAQLFAHGADAQSSFAEGNKAYEQGKFAEAAAQYRNAITNGMVREGVWFNLGNAEFKAGRLGHAIAAYRRAEQIAPRDSALRANLHFARKKATGDENPAVAWTRQRVRFLTFNEWSMLAAISICAVFLALAVAELRGVRISSGTFSVLLILALGFCAASGMSYFDRYLRSEGVVIAKQSAVRFGPLEESQTAFQLNDGAEVQITDSNADWLQVRDGRDRTGWTRRMDIALVSP